MLKPLFSFIFTLFIASGISAQTTTIGSPFYGTSGNIVMGTLAYHVSENLYYDSEIGVSQFVTSSTAIDSVSFYCTSVGTNTTFSNVNIYMKNVSSSITTLPEAAYSNENYTLVYSGSYTPAMTGWSGVSLSHPFVRAEGSNLQVMIERTDNVMHTGFVFYSSNNSLLSNSRRYNSNTLFSATSTLSTSLFRPSIQLIHKTANNATVKQLYTLGKLPVGSASSAVTALISNGGFGTLTNLPVTLTVSGANTYSATQTIGSLAVGATASVTFAGYLPSVTGSNILTVSVPDDEDNLDNTFSFNQVTTKDTIAYSNNDGISGTIIGFNTGSGCLLTKYQLNQSSILTKIRVAIGNNTATVGNALSGIVLSSDGIVIGQTDTYVIQASDLGSYVVFTFPLAVALSANTDYLIGLAQPANSTLGYYPLSVQVEEPARSGAYYSTGLTGGTPTEYTTLGRFMIEGIFTNESTTPVDYLSFTAKLVSKEALLNWATATETNNKGFGVERSADGKSFTSIGFVKGFGTTTTPQQYTFTDKAPLSGISYYRLQQTDLDGSTAASPIVSVDNVAKTAITVYPNPATNVIHVNTTGLAAGYIVVTDMSGKVVKTAIVAGGIVDIDVTSLPSGSYVVKVGSLSQIIIKK